MTTTEQPTRSPFAVFLARSGYTASDVLVYSDRTRVFVTSNGGKYQLTNKGGVRILKGPNYPKFQPE